MRAAHQLLCKLSSQIWHTERQQRQSCNGDDAQIHITNAEKEDYTETSEVGSEMENRSSSLR